MDSNTHSTSGPDRLGALAADLQGLANQTGGRLADGALAERLLHLRGLMDRLQGQWLADLADLDARGAAGTEEGVQAGSTAGWLRHRLHMGAGTAASLVRTARALYRGPSPAPARPWPPGSCRPPMPRCWPPAPTTWLITPSPRPNRCWWRRPGGWTRRGGGGPSPSCGWSPTPTAPTTEPTASSSGRGGLASTWEGMVAVNGLLDPEAGQMLVAALEPLARPAAAQDPRSGGQRRADALVELARRGLEGGRLPHSGGVRPQLLVTVDLDSLLGHHPGLGGETGGPWPLDPETCRRLACDGAVTTVVVTRHQPTSHHPGADGGLAARLRVAATRLPPALGGAPTRPLEVGRTSRVVTPAQRAALAVRDGGCSFPGCDRPLAWCEAHHLRHWLHGGPTDLANLALVCRAHHRAVHEGGWRLTRGRDGRLAAAPPFRKHRAAA